MTNGSRAVSEHSRAARRADERILAQVDNAIARFALDLRGLRVATEAASGPFAWTAAIALRAGAEEVVAVARDGPWGDATVLAAATRNAARLTGRASCLQITTDRLAAVSRADVITNLRGLRPLDDLAFAAMPRGSVVSLMCETWELRTEDVCLAAARRHGIPVLGTNEHDPRLGFMRYVGWLAIRLLLDAEAALPDAFVLVVGGGAFGSAIHDALSRMGVEHAFVVPPGSAPPDGALTLGARLDDASVADALRRADALLIADYESTSQWVGAEGADPRYLKACAQHLLLVHLAGVIDAAACRHADLTLWPDPPASAPRVMSRTTAILGPHAVVALHSAGLAVGATLARATRQSGGDRGAAERIALAEPLCMPFDAATCHRAGLQPIAS